ncbi:ras-related protein Rab-32C-like [Convolutriloba macropyga]|uniref:ras-related protein Rab-32C-like n=1 Tax=Convolutriloba macropyga TaxID=536237 RepID=UPI003F520946
MELPKVIQIKVVGDACTGKTSLIERYVTGNYNEALKATVGADFHNKTVRMDGSEYQVQVWDIAGSYRSHQNITVQFFRKSHAVMVCCNASQDNYIDHVKEWRDMVTDFAGEDVPCVLVMTQIDRYTPARNWQDDFKGFVPFDGFFQTSAKDDVGVAETFRELIRMAFDYLGSRRMTTPYNRGSSSVPFEESVRLDSFRQSQKKSCCKK